jgi:hypothetical protein
MSPEVGEEPPEVGETPPEVGEEPPEVGGTPPEVGEEPPEVGEEPPEVAEEPPEVGETPPEVAGMSPEVAGMSLLGAVSRLRRVRSKAPALQRSRFCKAAVETWRAASLLLRRRLETAPSHRTPPEVAFFFTGHATCNASGKTEPE